MIILLLCIGILLVLINSMAIKKEKKSFSDVFHSTEENMGDLDIKLGELRREFSETILDLQKEIVNIKEYIEDVNNNRNNATKEITTIEDMKSDIKQYDKTTKSVNNIDIKNSVKIDEINKLLSQGLSVEEIGAKLGMGKGEILLIKDLYLK